LESEGRFEMDIQDLYPIVVTDKRVECRDFYVRWFDFRVVFEASWFVYLATIGNRPFGIALMAPEHPSQPPGPDRFNGKGMFFTFQVEDAVVEFERLKRAGLPIAYPLHDEP
jgi:catechol 2,3-dioxygenase-like lactoylglutathione lyase family enzyme